MFYRLIVISVLGVSNEIIDNFVQAGGYRLKNDISIFRVVRTLKNIDISMIWTPTKNVLSIKQYLLMYINN